MELFIYQEILFYVWQPFSWQFIYQEIMFYVWQPFPWQICRIVNLDIFGLQQ